MSSSTPSIAKYPKRATAADFLKLRAEGIELVQALGSAHWTDYNTHDPGITILEALAYAITDLAYRSNWSIQDLLEGSSDQPFPTAARILTVSSVTIDDYRRLFIDTDLIKNAWLACRTCGCPGEGAEVRGLYDVWLEFESDESLGDLNDRTIETEIRVQDAHGELHEVLMEVRFPRFDLADEDGLDRLLGSDRPLAVSCSRLMRVKSGDSLSDVLIDDDELRQHWREVFYATLDVAASLGPVAIPDVSIRLFGSTDAKNATTTNDVVAALTGQSDADILPLYCDKQMLVAGILESAKATYAASRNLDEEICSLQGVEVQPVAFCAEIEVDPESDLEQVQGEIWFKIENYLSPAIPFYSLAELLESSVPVESIFEGPALTNGFIRQEDLDAATLRKEIRASDLINRLKDIEGIRAISNFKMTSYDSDAEMVDSQAWLLNVEEGHQPRLYRTLSNFKFYKAGLPFSVDEDEAMDVLTQLRGQSERPKQPDAESDLEVPHGVVRAISDISPVQYALPATYGIGPAGLPSNAATERKGHAKQLKAYLQVFEQILANGFEQLSHLGDLFSLDEGIDRTYFGFEFNESRLNGYHDVVGDLDSEALQDLMETSQEFRDRRNAFLDHVMSRFGEDFNDYALVLTNWKGEAVAEERLIHDKISFLRAYESISKNRFVAFNRRLDPSDPSNGAVLHRRMSLLLGFPDLSFSFEVEEQTDGSQKVSAYALSDSSGNAWLEGTLDVSSESREVAVREATLALLRAGSRSTAYALAPDAEGQILELKDSTGTLLGRAGSAFETVDEAEEHAEELMAWASNARGRVIEHLLLRPKFPGDALYRECSECADDDPFSFRLTLVMPGWSAPYSTNLDFRAFANRTLLEEIPSHLVGKVCWVGNEDFEIDECEPILRDLAEILEAQAVDASGAAPDCEAARGCATAIYDLHAQVIGSWHAAHLDRIYEYETLKRLLGNVVSRVESEHAGCELEFASSWDELQALLIEHFTERIARGMQFERFENAWYAWLEEDSHFDWSEEQLQAHLEAMLAQASGASSVSELCRCAEAVLRDYGQAYRNWMESNLALGRELEEFGQFVPPEVQLCSEINFAPGTQTIIQSFLDAKYQSYTKVSYALGRLVAILEQLHSVYPAATLHDCAEGNDANPVRLNQTALGTLGLGTSESIDLNPPEP